MHPSWYHYTLYLSKFFLKLGASQNSPQSGFQNRELNMTNSWNQCVRKVSTEMTYCIRLVYEHVSFFMTKFLKIERDWDLQVDLLSMWEELRAFLNSIHKWPYSRFHPRIRIHNNIHYEVRHENNSWNETNQARTNFLSALCGSAVSAVTRPETLDPCLSDTW